MTARLTPLALSILTLGAWGLVFAVLSGRPELVVVVIPALFGLLRRPRLPSPDDWHITHALSTERAFEGDRVVVTVTVRAARPIALLELFEPLPPSLRVVSGFNRGFFTLARGGEARWRYEVECRRRGRSILGTLHARLWTRGGLHASERSNRLPVSLRVYPRTSSLKRLPRPSRTQTSVGNYVASSVGEGLEPADIRTFAPGDRLRHVNWRASLRFRRLFVTQYHPERNADIVLMLDALTELGAPPATTLDASIRAAASLASAYLAQRDRVGLVEYSGPFRWVRPGSGRVQLERLLDALLRADVVFSYVQGDVALVPRRVLPPQSLVVAISPLLDARFEKALVDLAGRGFEVVIVSPSPIPIVLESVRQSPSVDLACRLWALDRRARAAALRRLGLTVIEWNPNDSLEVALGAIGRGRRRGVAS